MAKVRLSSARQSSSLDRGAGAFTSGIVSDSSDQWTTEARNGGFSWSQQAACI